MTLKELVSKYQNYLDQYLFIKKISRDNPLTNKEDLYNILTLWRKISKQNTIGIEGNQTKQIFIRIYGNIYHIHADSDKEGIGVFLANRENPWCLIRNNNGTKNKITNDGEKKPISGFYMYK